MFCNVFEETRTLTKVQNKHLMLFDCKKTSRGQKFMKKILLTLLTAFLLGGFVNAQTASCPAGPNFYPDVPAGHWASTAVSRLSDLGIIIGFPDGLYRGNENLTRYQAALMFYRLIECYFPIIPQSSLSHADLDALRRAIQELTGRVASVESGVSANASGIASNAASIAAIESRIAGLAGLHTRIDELQRAIANLSIPAPVAGASAVSDEVLQALRNQLQALQVKADTALATAQNAQALAEQGVDLTAIQNRINQNKRSIDSLNDLAASLNSDVANLQERVSILEGHEHAPAAAAVDLSGIRSDIGAIREFTVLLRRRQADLEGRVAALEQRGDGGVADLARRVDAIEGKLFEFSGTLELEYIVRRHSIFDENLDGIVNDPLAYDSFDIDRIFGKGFDRELPDKDFGGHLGHSALTSGVEDDDDEDDYDRITDFNGPVEGEVDPELEIAFGFASGSSGCGSPRQLNCFSGIIQLELAQLIDVDTDDDDADPDPFVYAFNFADAELHYSPIGGGHLVFEFGRDLDVDFTGYVVDTGNSDEDDEDDADSFEDLSSGFAAHFDAADYLEAFSPRLTFFYGTNPDPEGALEATYAWGARAELSLLDDNVTLGGSYATMSRNAGDYNNELEDNDTLSVFGVDGMANIGIFDLDFEFASEQENDSNELTDDASRSLFFAILGIDTEAIRLGGSIQLKALELNYRDIPLGWNGINGGEEEDIGEESEFELDQRGFGLKAGVKLFIFDFNAYFDAYGIEDIRNGNFGSDFDRVQTTAFGAEGDINIFSGIAVTGFFRSVSIDDGNGQSGTVDSTEGGRTFLQDETETIFANEGVAGLETTRDDARYVDREFYDDDH